MTTIRKKVVKIYDLRSERLFMTKRQQVFMDDKSFLHN